VQLVGGALYLGLIAVFALGIGTILRSSAGGISAVLGILFLAPIVLGLIPADWAQETAPYLLSNVGSGIYRIVPEGQPVMLDNVQSLGVALAWVGASLAGAALLLKRRDA
jgi:ABC-2 type transport system permease protein